MERGPPFTLSRWMACRTLGASCHAPSSLLRREGRRRRGTPRIAVPRSESPLNRERRARSRASRDRRPQGRPGAPAHADGAPIDAVKRLVPQIVQLIDDREHGRTVIASMQRAWKNREFLAFYERPLLLFAALRGDAMATDRRIRCTPRCVTPRRTRMSSRRPPCAARSIASRTGLWTTLGLRRVQTNDTSRDWPGCGPRRSRVARTEPGPCCSSMWGAARG